MPKVKQIEKCKHPNSRKTKALVKQLKKQSMRGKSKLSTNIKQNLLGEKVLWFRDNLKPEQDSYTVEDVEKLILQYLGRFTDEENRHLIQCRFNDELEQIRLKHAIGQRKSRQHANREDIIKMTLKREREEFQTAGIEMPDLLNTAQFNILKNWTGQLRFLQNFKLRRFSLKNLKAEADKIVPSKTSGNDTKLENMNENKDKEQDQVREVNQQSSLIVVKEVDKGSKGNIIESMDVDR